MIKEAAATPDEPMGRREKKFKLLVTTMKSSSSGWLGKPQDSQSEDRTLTSDIQTYVRLQSYTGDIIKQIEIREPTTEKRRQKIKEAVVIIETNYLHLVDQRPHEIIIIHR